jgi:flagellar biosynthesis component FlhA
MRLRHRAGGRRATKCVRGDAVAGIMATLINVIVGMV